MVTLDSDHRESHVGKELSAYAPLVSDGQYLVVEDSQDPRPGRAYHAVEMFLVNNPEWERVPVERQFLLCVTRLGWLRRKVQTRFGI
jgi:cephalosporin hydroxylase